MLSSGNKLSVQFSLFLQLLFVMNNSCKFLKEYSLNKKYSHRLKGFFFVTLSEVEGRSNWTWASTSLSLTKPDFKILFNPLICGKKKIKIFKLK